MKIIIKHFKPINSLKKKYRTTKNGNLIIKRIYDNNGKLIDQNNVINQKNKRKNDNLDDSQNPIKKLKIDV